METKICKKCGEDKKITEFGKHKSTKTGIRSTCKFCESILYKEWKKNNKEKVKKQKQNYLKKNKQKNLDRGKEYRKNNREKNLLRSETWRSNNPDYAKLYYQNNKQKINENYKNKKNNCPIFKLKSHLRSSINKILNGKKNSKTFDIIGCTAEFLKEHLEKQFTEGMNWENHGQFGWHIDHKTPLASASTEEELLKLCHYTNLQPLWWRENIIKGKKIQD